MESFQHHFLLLGLSIPNMHIYNLISGLGLIELSHLTSRAIFSIFGDGERDQII